MLTQRPVNTEQDREFILNLCCLRDWEELPVWARSSPYLEYREGWLATSKPQEIVEELAESLEDPRTVAEVWAEGRTPVAFLWVTFSTLGSQAFAEIRSLVVSLDHQRRGIGGLMLRRAEEEAQRQGAVSLRSEMSESNQAARAMHGKQGFKVATAQYEKLLAPTS